MVINLAASSATKAIRALITRAIWGAEPEPLVKAVPNMATVEIIENYDSTRQPVLSAAQRDAKRKEEKTMPTVSSGTSSGSSSSGSLPPPASLGTRITDGMQLQVVECSNDELEKLMASIQLPPSHDPRVPKNAQADKPPQRVAIPAMVDADRLAAVLDRSTRKLEESVGEYGYPKLEELTLDDFTEADAQKQQKVQWVLAQSIMAEDGADQTKPAPTTERPDVNLLRSHLQPQESTLLAKQPYGSPTARYTVPQGSLIASWFEMPPSAPPLSISDFEMISTPKDVRERSTDEIMLNQLLDDDDPFISERANAFGTRSQPVDARTPSPANSQ